MERRINSGENQFRPWNSPKFLGFVLLVLTVFLYSPVRNHAFIYYDDNVYVIDNPQVNTGMSWETLRWALTSTEHANWHPLTWLSHAFDCQLFGLEPGSHHLVNVALHAANAVLLFMLLVMATGAAGRSFVVAALFAWHPLNVESVAWIAERKNLLCIFFFLTTLGLYGWYARKPGWRRMLVVSGSFLLALASKPMAVTLPFVLLLLDYWPLQRLGLLREVHSRLGLPTRSVRDLVLEKIPLFALSTASCGITLFAQKTAMQSLQSFPLATRLANAITSYAIYLWRTVWPTGLAVYYPVSAMHFWRLAAAATLICAVSLLIWAQRSTRPYLIVGWLWFLGTLVPVIGIVQVGDQAMADRYAYLPLSGLFLAGVWGGVELLERLRAPVSLGWAATAVLLGILCLLTVQQLGYWENDVTLWSHALQVTPQNETAESQLAAAFVFRGDHDSALPHLLNVVRMDPTNIAPHVSIGAAYMIQGRKQEAIDQFEAVVRLSDHDGLSPRDRNLRSTALLNLGFSDVAASDYARALGHFRQAKKADPGMVAQAIRADERALASENSESDYLELALLLQAAGQEEAAVSVLEHAITTNPRYEESYRLLSYLKPNHVLLQRR